MKRLDEILGRSPGMAAIRDRIARLISRASDARRLPPVLIQGETGTGKGLVAQALHRAGPRATGPFVDVNCAAIPESLLEAEMFGYERGAFTDARQAKRGLFQAAHQGTLFLDEVGLLPDGLQAKLLKVIEERVVRRLGATQGETVDIWVVTATNADLAAATRERRFREDLYHRLAVLTIALPPLRERGEDVILLAQHFLGRACADYGLAPKTFSAEAREALATYPWPGNVRELANVMERVALLAEATVVTDEMLGLPTSVPDYRAQAETVDPDEPERPRGALADAVESVERSQLADTLRETSGNVSQAAARLGISRNTLRYRMEKYALRPGMPAVVRRPRLPAPASPRFGPPAVPSPAPAAAPAHGPVRWERRRLSLLRAALPAVPGQGGPIESSRVLEMLVDKVQSFGGRIEDLGVSGVVGVFGLGPLEHPAWRAANAALAILRATGPVGDEEPPAVRIGLHLATLLVGRLGEIVQIEADTKREVWRAIEALTAGAEPGSIVVSPAAAPFLERRFDLAPTSGGRADGIEGYRLARSERPLFEPGRRLAPFVGRQADLAHLRDLLTAAAEGRGQLVSVVGESGIGKSRLLHELRVVVAGQPVTYLEAHCFDYGTATPYLPILELIRQSCRVLDGDPPIVVATKIRQGLVDVGADAAEWAPYLLHLLGIRDGAEALATQNPETIRTRTFEAVRQLTLLGSGQRPLVLVIEDLQWVDRASGEMIGALADALQAAPVVLVATHRPGYRPAWLDRSYASQIVIGPLGAGDSLAVVRSVLPDAGLTPVTQAIVQRAQGNPFFLEELARTLAEHGALGPVPETVQEAVLARVDRLPDVARRLVQTASVLGRDVPLRLLRELWDGALDLEAPLRDLVRQEILDEHGGSGEPDYAFRHALTQEVVYASVLEPDRRRSHGAAGRALERLYVRREEEIVERLAYHFGRSDDGERAVDYALRAAEKAQRRWANADAVEYFDAAVARLDGLPDTEWNRLRRIDAVVRQAEVKFALGRHAEHIGALEAIRPLVDTVADPTRRAAWYYWTGFLHILTRGRPEVAVRYCSEAARIADAVGLEEIRAFSDCCLSQAYLMMADFRGSLEAGERSLAVFERRGNTWWACRALWALTAAANALGEWERSLAYCSQALAHADAVNDVRLKVVARWRTGWAEVLRGNPTPGIASCDAALALGPSPYDAAMVRAARGYGLVRTGDVATGVAELGEAVTWFARSQLPFTRLFFTAWLGEGLCRHGDRVQARAMLEEVLATSQELGYRYTEGLAHRLLAEAMVDESPLARRHLESAEAVFREAGAADTLARLSVLRGELEERDGNLVLARSLTRQALEQFERLGTLDETVRTQTRLTELDARGAG